MRGISLVLAGSVLAFLAEPSWAIYKIAVTMTRADTTIPQAASDGKSCRYATERITLRSQFGWPTKYWKSNIPAFLRCMNDKGYQLDPAGLLVTVFYEEKPESIPGYRSANNER